MSKFSSAGVYKWVHAFGSTNNDRALGAGADNSGDVFVTGFFNGTANLAPGDGGCSQPADNVTPTGSADAFLIKYLPSGCW